MKIFLFILITFLSCNCIAQAKSDIDTTIIVTYTNKKQTINRPAYFINGISYPNGVSSSLNPNTIHSIEIIKEDFLINNINYSAKVLIQTKEKLTPKLITLNELKAKYTNLGDKPAIFSFDGKIIHEDYNEYTIAEDYIMQIVVDRYQNINENMDVYFINIVRKTNENIKKSKEMRVRGGNDLAGASKK